MYNNIQKYYPGFLFFAKVIIVILAYQIISEKILHEHSYQLFFSHLATLNEWIVPFVLVLLGFSLINWVIEVRKWKILVSCLRTISFSESLRQSLASLTVSLLTPNRIGEYGAKALFFQKQERARIVLYNFLGNFSQMSATLFFGLIGFWALSARQYPVMHWSVSWSKMGVWMVTVLIGLLILKRLWKNFYRKMVNNLRSLPLPVQLRVFSLSFLKYLVFSHQFYFLLLFFGADMNYFLCMSLISTTYLISSLIPGFVVFDWLVKGSVAVVVFGQSGTSEVLILSITSVMWILNFAIPSALGTFFVFSYRSPQKLQSKIALEK